MPGKRKAIWGWMFFDWANQPFHTLILTFTFAPYFASKVAADPAQGQAAWGYAISIGSIVIALMAPVLGAVADARGPRRPWILIFSAPLCRWRCRALGRDAGVGRSDASPGLPRRRPDRGGVHQRLHQLTIAGAWKEGRNRPHLRLGLGDGILGWARKLDHRARPDGADPGIGKKPSSVSILSSASTRRMARAPAPPARCRQSGTSFS